MLHGGIRRSVLVVANGAIDGNRIVVLRMVRLQRAHTVSLLGLGWDGAMVLIVVSTCGAGSLMMLQLRRMCHHLHLLRHVAIIVIVL